MDDTEIWFQIRYHYKQALKTYERSLMYISGISYFTNVIQLHHRKQISTILNNSSVEMKTKQIWQIMTSVIFFYGKGKGDKLGLIHTEMTFRKIFCY